MLNQSVVVVDEASGSRECLGRPAVGKERLRPLSTYRLQFNRAFRFSDARKLIGYLHELGVGTCYASPILKAHAGSMHGYDIIDHNAINPELGTQEEFDELAAELKSHGMGLLLDVVPNHMGVGHGTNPWWQDVLQNGRASKFADFFDIDWNPLKGELHNKVLLPILGNQYGEELDSGRLVLKYADGDFRIDYYDKILPVDPQTIPLIFEPLGDFTSLAGEESARELMGVLAGFAELPKHDTADPERAMARQREAPFIGQRLRDMVERKPEIKRLVEEALRRINGRPGDGRSFDALHKLLEAQAVPPGALARLRRGDQLPALFRHQRPGRAAHGRPEGFRRDGSPDPATARRRHGVRTADRSPRRAVEPAAVLCPAADALCRQPMLRQRTEATAGRERNRAGAAKRLQPARRGSNGRRCTCWWRRYWSRERICRETGRSMAQSATTLRTW